MGQHLRGVLFWILVFTSIGLFLQSLVGSISWADWLSHHETLATGILAVGGAILAYVGIRDQIDQADHARRDEIERRNDAARALLPASLSALSSYAESCVNSLFSMLPDDPPQQQVTNCLRPVPTVPEGVLKAFGEAIRLASPQNRIGLATLLTALQVQHARLASYAEPRQRVSLDVCGRILDAVELYSGIANTYDYGRRRSNAVQIPPSRDDVRSALHNCRIFDDTDLERLVDEWTVHGSTYRLAFPD